MRYLEGSAPGGVTAPAHLRAGRQRGFAPMAVHLAGNSLIQVFQAKCTRSKPLQANNCWAVERRLGIHHNSADTKADLTGMQGMKGIKQEP